MSELKKLSFINPDRLERFSLRSSAVVQVGDKYLMVLNEGKSKYKLPGGHLDDRESFQNALTRELKEEVGIDIENLGSPSFYDQLIVEGLIVITAYFKFHLENFDTAITPLPTRLFEFQELSVDNTFESETRAISMTLT